MTRLVLHQHPFAQYCQKVLIAFGELGLPFESRLVEGRGELARLWPPASIPVLVDEEAGVMLPESSAIIEYLDGLGGGGLVPGVQARLWDRICDHHVADQVGKVVTDQLRPDDGHDSVGVEQARQKLDTAYGVLETQLARDRWLAGDTFTIADCSAASALFYAWVVHRWQPDAHPSLTRYYGDVMARPSVHEVIEAARPYREVFPLPWPEDADAHRPGDLPPQR